MVSGTSWARYSASAKLRSGRTADEQRRRLAQRVAQPAQRVEVVDGPRDRGTARRPPPSAAPVPPRRAGTGSPAPPAPRSRTRSCPASRSPLQSRPSLSPASSSTRPMRVDVPHAVDVRVVAQQRRAAGLAHHPPHPERVRAEQVGLQRHDRPVPGGDAGERLDAELVLQVHGQVDRAELGARAVARRHPAAGPPQRAATALGPLHGLRDVPGLRRLDLGEHAEPRRLAARPRAHRRAARGRGRRAARAATGADLRPTAAHHRVEVRRGGAAAPADDARARPPTSSCGVPGEVVRVDVVGEPRARCVRARQAGVGLGRDRQVGVLAQLLAPPRARPAARACSWCRARRPAARPARRTPRAGCPRPGCGRPRRTWPGPAPARPSARPPRDRPTASTSSSR